jgi:hypothetical protein
MYAIMSAVRSILTVNRGKDMLVRVAHIHEVLRYTPAWFSHASSVVKLLESIPDKGEVLDRLRGSYVGARELPKLLETYRKD